jgi:hypothetical protein
MEAMHLTIRSTPVDASFSAQVLSTYVNDLQATFYSILISSIGISIKRAKELISTKLVNKRQFKFQINHHNLPQGELPSRHAQPQRREAVKTTL